MAIESLWQHKATVREILPLCSTMREALSDAMKIWQDSTDLGRGGHRDFIFKLVIAYDDSVRGMIGRSEATLNDVLAPEVSVNSPCMTSPYTDKRISLS